MKKGLKIILIVLGVLIGVIILDTMQAKIFDNSPLLKIRDNLDGGSTDYIDKGLFVNHYHCNNNEKVTTWKKEKYTCPISNNTSNRVSIKALPLNALTEYNPVSIEAETFILSLFEKYEYTTETCDGENNYSLIVDKNTYGIEAYGFGISEHKTELHITVPGKEIVLNEEDSLKLLKIINTYVPDNYKPVVYCLKDRLGAYIADQSLEFKEKDITSLINIDKSKLDYSYLETNEHDGFYLIVKGSYDILKEVKNELESKYQKINYKNYEGYDLYIYNGNDLLLDDKDFTICQIN